MRGGWRLLAFFVVSGCAFPQEVRHLGVSYNTAVADLGDQLTLLNIERAEEGLPLHYTSFSRLSGSLVFTGAGSVNGALHASGSTRTTSTSTVASATPSVTSGVQDAVATGGDVFTPNLSAQISTGPTFDVNVLDTQEFYQGILKEVPFTTVNALLASGYSDQLLMHILVHRIDYVQVDPEGDPAKNRLLASFVNEPGRTGASPEKDPFEQLVRCLRLRGVAAAPFRLAPMSRVTHDAEGKVVQLKLDDLAKLDGKTLDLDDEVDRDPSRDWDVEIQRPATDTFRPALDFVGLPGCMATGAPADASYASASLRKRDINGGANAGSVDQTELNWVWQLAKPGLTAPRLSPSGAKAASTTGPSTPDIQRFITFRSPEGAIKYLGEYLRVYHLHPERVPTVGDRFVFETAEKPTSGNVVVSARIGRTTYAIVRPGPADLPHSQYRRDLDVLALVESLVNLQKKSDDRLTTVPVELVR